MMPWHRTPYLTLVVAVVASLAAACDGPEYMGATTRDGRDGERPSPDSSGDSSDRGDGPVVNHPVLSDELGSAAAPDATGDGYATGPTAPEELDEEWAARLEERDPDYGAALRRAALRLLGNLPSLADVKAVEEAPDPREAYERVIDSYLEDRRFTFRMLDYWRDTFKMGGNAQLDTAPLLATRLVVDDEPFTQLFTAPSGNCPTLDREAGEILPEDCDNGVPAHAGVLTNPAVMEHFFSNLAFRRVRWLQETFVCRPFPAEFSDEPQDVGGENPYTAPWPWESISGEDTGGRIDFHDTESVICANCHATMNHLAPLFGRFDEGGQWQDGFAVPLPLDGRPTAERTDWLPEGEGTAWRFGAPVEDLPALGATLAADPAVLNCMAARMWNWAMGKGDIVTNLSVVPSDITRPIVRRWSDSDYRMKEVVRQVYTSEHFVRF